jgi:hypothetical protein
VGIAQPTCAASTSPAAATTGSETFHGIPVKGSSGTIITSPLVANMPAIVAAAIAAFAALVGYLVNQSALRRERRISTYAEALRALRPYQDIPYRIARRSKSDGEKREELGILLSESVAQVRFYQSWLRIHSRQVGDAYDLLFDKVRKLAYVYRSDAWNRPLIETDSEMSDSLRYPYRAETKKERLLCLAAMQADLSSFSVLKMPKIRRRIRELKSEEGLMPSRLTPLRDGLSSGCSDGLDPQPSDP